MKLARDTWLKARGRAAALPRATPSRTRRATTGWRPAGDLHDDGRNKSGLVATQLRRFK
jgi:hypothetical protein